MLQCGLVLEKTVAENGEHRQSLTSPQGQIVKHQTYIKCTPDDTAQNIGFKN